MGPIDYVTSTGDRVLYSDVDLVATMLSVQRIHHAFAGTGALCLAGASRITGTIAWEMALDRTSEMVRIGHPKGVASVAVRSDPSDGHIEAVGVSRTARVIMRGDIYFRP